MTSIFMAILIVAIGFVVYRSVIEERKDKKDKDNS